MQFFMKILIITICLAISILIIKNKSYKRFTWFIIGVCFLSMDIIISVSPPINAHVLLIISFIISLLYHKEYMTSWKAFPIHSLLSILFFTHIMVGIMDERLNLVSRISRPLFVFSQTYFCIFIGYASFRKLSEWPKLLRTIIIIFGIVGIYGIITYVLQNNPYYDTISQAFSSTNEKGMFSDVQERGYRVCSFLNNPIPYGIIMGFVSLFTINYFKKNTPLTIVLLTIMIINIFLSNSRSAVLSFILLIIIYNTIQLRYNLKIKYFIGVILIISSIIISYNFFPIFNNSINNIVDIFTNGGNNVTGSNIELKQTQWTKSLHFFNINPVWGNGYFFFWENINIYGKDIDLAGLEGYIYKLLVEEGIIQIIAVSIFFASLIRFFILEWNKFNNHFVCCGISIILTFIFFIISVGTYGNVFVFSFILLGVIMKYIELLKNEINESLISKNESSIKTNFYVINNNTHI